MCELFGMSGNKPLGLNNSLRLFKSRGGDTGDNPDGWGVAYVADGAFQLKKEPIPAANSQYMNQLCDQVLSNLVVAHVRKAKHPMINNVNNTHPFRQNCCGREWIFAHNGLVSEMMSAQETPLLGSQRPHGDTDSEYAFRYLLERLAACFSTKECSYQDNWLTNLAAVSELIASYGQFNFLMSDGSHLIAYGHDRLHSLERQCQGLRLCLIATEPLTNDEYWEPFAPGELCIYKNGEKICHFNTTPPAPEPIPDEIAETN